MAQLAARSVYVDRSDEDLVRAYVRGDDAAFEEVVRRYGSGIKAYAHRMLRNAEHAEDIYVETFATLVRRREQLQPRGTIRGYLFTIAHRLCIDAVRHRRTAYAAIPQLVAIGGGRQQTTTSEMEVEAAELYRDIERAIDTLSVEHRQVLLLRTVHGLSTRETADAVGLEPGQVRSQLSWARKRIRAMVSGDQGNGSA